MAFVAGGTEILIIIFLRVFVVHVSLIVLVTQNALKDCVVCRLNMAGGAIIPPDSSMRARCDREILRVMIPVCGCPPIGRMTGLAGVREIGRRMVRIRGSIIVSLVARKAGRWGTAIRSRMTGDTGRGDVLARQREGRGVVVKCRRQPSSRGVAGCAVVVEIVRYVIGVDHALKVSLMAGIAVGRRANISRGMT